MKLSDDVAKWPEGLKLTNEMVHKGVLEFKSVNVTTLRECVARCCEKVNCNYAFLQELSQCFLIACVDDELCQPEPNKHKLPREPVDFLVKVRSVGKSILNIIRMPNCLCLLAGLFMLFILALKKSPIK
jgi:hypothetical protein